MNSKAYFGLIPLFPNHLINTLLSCQRYTIKGSSPWTCFRVPLTKRCRNKFGMTMRQVFVEITLAAFIIRKMISFKPFHMKGSFAE